MLHKSQPIEVLVDGQCKPLVQVFCISGSFGTLINWQTVQKNIRKQESFTIFEYGEGEPQAVRGTFYTIDDFRAAANRPGCRVKIKITGRKII